MTKEEIITVLKSGIDAFNIVEFCPNGGWPMFDNLDMRIYNQQTNGLETIVDADILYNCKSPDGCFPGHNNGERLRKIITIEYGVISQITDPLP